MKYTKKYNKRRKPKTQKKRPKRKSRKHGKKRGGGLFSKKDVETKEKAFNDFKNNYPIENFENGNLPFEGNIAMAGDFKELYDVIKDATKSCKKDDSFKGSEGINKCNQKKREYYTELARYLTYLQPPLQKAAGSRFIFNKGDQYRYLIEEEQDALQEMEDQVETLVKQTGQNLAERT